jgi:cytochrome c-type biogenesis protein CcmH/NrfG
VETSQASAEMVKQAKEELNRGDLPTAVNHYTKLIKKGKHLDETIRDLRESLYRYPVEVSIWQTLGDAYMRANRLQDALDAYNKAEELLR